MNSVSDNAELWSRCDEQSIRIKLECWLRTHNVNYDEDMTTEELRQLYIYTETHI